MNDEKFKQEKQQAEAVAKEIIQYAEKALKECFKSFYESTRISTDIKAIDTKLKSLIEIRNTFAQNPHKPAAAYEDISKTINELQAEMRKKRSEQVDHEGRLFTFAKELINKIVQLTEQRCGSFEKMYSESVKEFKASVNRGLEQQLSKVLEDIEALKECKLDKTEGGVIRTEFEATKARMVDLTRRTIQTVSSQIEQNNNRQRAFFEECKQELDMDKISEKAEAAAMKKLNTRLADSQREILKAVKNENEEALKSFPNRISEAVRKEVSQQVGPANLQKIIESLPDFKALKTLSEKLLDAVGDQEKQRQNTTNVSAGEAATAAAATAVVMASQDSIKQSIQHLSAELAQLKQKSESTRAIVETLRTQGVPNSNDALQKFDQTTAVKHIEEMQREIELMHNNIKMIEPVIKMRAQAVEDKAKAISSMSTDDSRKRPRTNDDAGDIAMRDAPSDATSNAAVLEKILEIDAKHQNLLDFLLQYKETVLNDTFPARLEAALKKIEQVLRNHETFISYLIDPFTTAKKVHSVTLPSASASNSSSSANDALKSLNPAMLDAISQLVKRTAEEMSLPLQKKIKLLEEKLEAKEQANNSKQH